MSNPSRRDPRRVAFALLATVAVAVAVGYTTWAARRGRASAVSRDGAATTREARAVGAILGGSRTALMFRNDVPGEHWAHMALVPLGAAEAVRAMVPMRCERLHFAAGRGLCIAPVEGFVGTYEAQVFGPDFQVLHRVALGGLPSRARVSPDGRFGATTVFQHGHSYAETGFSTETTLLDLTSGAKLGNLEEFAVTRDGAPFKAIDFNFWGVTFTADGNRFYVTLATRGQTYLVEGEVATRRMRVVRSNVECPSLSPDGTRLAFKKRVRSDAAGVSWRFHVLDLATMQETPLAETRSLDDQIAWLDDHNVLYQVARNVWVVPADGSGEPRPFLGYAASPAVIETAALTPSMSVETFALPVSDVAVVMSAASDPAQLGADLTYTVTVTNQGPDTATDVALDAKLPLAATFKSLGRGSPPTVSYGCTVQGGYVSCTVTRLAPQDSWTIQFTVRPTAAGSLRSGVMLGGPHRDAVAANDRATVVVSVR